MRTCSSPGPGSGGSGTSRSASTSGPPNPSQTTAFIAQTPAAAACQPLSQRRAADDMPPRLSRQAGPPGRDRCLMRHQNRYGHMIEQIAADAADQSFAQLRVMIQAGDNQVGSEIGGTGE